MMPESLLYLPLTIHIGSRSDSTYAPMMPNPLLIEEDVSAYILTQSQRTLHQGLYVRDGDQWQFAMPQPVLSDVLIKGSQVDVYIGLSTPIVVGPSVRVYRNGVLYEPRTLEGGVVYCLVSPDSSGETTVFMEAAQPLSGHRVIKATPAGADYASCDIPADAEAVVGISTGAAAAGDFIKIQTDGEITEPSWNWNVGKPIFCGLNGTLTQVSPAVGYSLVVGIAIGPATILISVKQPIVLN